MRRSLLLASIVVLALAASSPTQGATFSERVAGSESISLKYGQGYAVIANRGAALGRMRRGWIRVIDIPGGGAPSGRVRGCEARSGRLTGGLYCRGRDLSFYIHGGTWRIRMSGRGINVSGVVRGSLGLDRIDDGSGIYSIGGAEYRRWPATLSFFAVHS